MKAWHERKPHWAGLTIVVLMLAAGLAATTGGGQTDESGDPANGGGSPGSGGSAPDAATAPVPLRLGMDIDSIADQAASDVRPDLGMLWVGPWNLRWGWSGPDAQLAKARSQGVTPVIQFYYWGDDISQSCLENGCWSDLHDAPKNRAAWDQLAAELVDRLDAKLAGAPAVIVLETEFNKGDVARYEPLDGYLAAKAQFFKSRYPATEIVMGLGNWGLGDWGTWDRTAAASDAIGLQGLRGSTRDRLAHYMDLAGATVASARELQDRFGKPVFVTDIGLSSYPEPDYADHQAAALSDLFSRLGDLKAAGVTALLYRSCRDNPHFDTANYYGPAERHWGLMRADGSAKPALAAWIEGVTAERRPPAPEPTPTPVTTTATTAPTARETTSTTMPTPPVAGRYVEAEGFSTKTAGGKIASSGASGGSYWNLWSNGRIQTPVTGLATGYYEVRVWAGGTSLEGVGPNMKVTWDGEALIQAKPTGGFRPYVAWVPVTQGTTYQLAVHFTNDAMSGREDRNLHVDAVRIGWSFGKQAEAFSERPVGAQYADATASDGKYWNLWSNGELRQSVYLPGPGTYELRVRAQGEEARGLPHMVVKLAGGTVLEADASGDGWRWYSGTVTVGSAGERTLSVAFTNDHWHPRHGDRNLLLDKVDVVWVGPA